MVQSKDCSLGLVFCKSGRAADRVGINMVPKIIWMFLALTAFTNATAYVNELDEDDTSIEDTNIPRRPYYRESADSLYSKPTLSEDAIFLPHEKFCQYFYAFDGVDSYIYRCASGYRFDAEKLQCMKAKNVDCGKRKKDIDSSEEDDVRINFKCPKWSGVFPHNHYCHLFFYCQNKKPSLFMCPPGKYFDKDRNGCYKRNKVDCGKREDPYDENDLKDVAEPDAHSDKVYSCENPAGVFPDNEYCNKFIRCWYGAGELYVCPKGKLFDKDLMKCRSKDSVYCHGRKNPYDREFPTTTEEVVTVKDLEFKCPKEKGKFPHPRDCSKFYECKKWNHKEYKCPKHKLFDAKRQSCEDDDRVICDDRIHPDMDPDEPEDKMVDPNPRFSCKNNYGRFPHDEYCHWYYNCHNKKATVRECKKGKYYDTKKGKCHNAKDVSCDGRKKPQATTLVPITTTPVSIITTDISTTRTTVPTTTPTTTSSTYTTVTFVPTTTTTVAPTTTTPATTTISYPATKPNTPPPTDCNEDDVDCIIDKTGDVKEWFECPKRYGHFSHGSNQQLFIHCNNWVPFVKRCAKNTIFLPKYLICMRV